MKKLLLFIIVGMFFMSLISAESIGTFQQGEDVELYQTCNNCTFCNFTSVKTPGGNVLSNVIATQDGTYFYYNLDKGNTSALGEYTYCYDCGNAIERATGCLEFFVTGDGEAFQQFPTQFILIIIGFSFIIFGLFKERYRMFKYLGSIIFLVMGVLTLYPGYSFINWSTLFGKSLGFSLVGLGFYFLIEDSFSRDNQQDHYDQRHGEYEED